jgi:predicted enzyme related to lactoylglutathione lyase
LTFFGDGVAEPATNKSIIIEFLVENVDDNYKIIKDLTTEIVQEPTTMPWGNRSLLFRDPDGNLINFFTPVSDEAKKKFA